MPTGIRMTREVQAANRTTMREERGFALLIVFLFAAAVAVMLYREMPRVAFESQRAKEQVLMDRGQQYVRAIQLFVVANKRYPARIEDLENTNQKRYLRRRYIDPMTGKDEWRLIHVNAAGLLTDSLVTKPPTPTGDAGQLAGSSPSPTGNGGLSLTPFSASPLGAQGNARQGNTGQDNPQAAMNPAVARRPSDRLPGGGVLATAPVENPDDPSTWGPISLLPPSNPQRGAQGQIIGQGLAQPFGQASGQIGSFPGQSYPGQQPSGQPFPGQFAGQPAAGFPGQQQFPGAAQTSILPGGFQPGLPGQTLPGQNTGQPTIQTGMFPGVTGPNQFRVGPDGQLVPVTNPPGQSANPQAGTQPFQPFQPFSPPPQTAGGFTPANTGGITGSTVSGVAPAANQAAAAANQANPALQAINALLTGQNAASPAGQGIAGSAGIVGVASTFEGPSIKTYKDRSKYNEWEFIFDMKSTLPAQGQGRTAGPTGNGPGQSPAPGTTNPFGTAPIFPSTPPR